MHQIENELRSQFSALSAYLDEVFKWVNKEVSERPGSIIDICERKKIPGAAVYYAMIFLQVDEQIKYEAAQQPGSISADNQLYSLWTYLLSKLESYHYLPESDFAERRAEMAELIKNND